MKCDRCGIKAGSHPKGYRFTSITIEEMEVAGRIWHLCNRCRSHLSVYKPIPK